LSIIRKRRGFPRFGTLPVGGEAGADVGGAMVGGGGGAGGGGGGKDEGGGGAAYVPAVPYGADDAYWACGAYGEDGGYAGGG
jgi:hypothetical protein